MTDRAALIARITAATEPSRELDAEIALAFGWLKQPDPSGFVDFYWTRRNGSGDFAEPPGFTISIDSALTLVKPGIRWALSMWEDHAGFETGLGMAGDPGCFYAVHKLAPLAIVLAALRMTENGNG
jgi:hypothetical protein